MINKKNIFTIYSLLFISFLIRAILSIIYSDSYLDNEWGIILHNFEVSGIYGLNVVIDDFYASPKFADNGEKVLPTVYMPPLYFVYIYLIKLLNNNIFNLVYLVIFSQIILSTISIYIFYKIIKIYENKLINILLFTALFAFFPINIYATLQISSITLQLFLTVLFLYFLPCHNYRDKNNYLFYFSIVSGLLILIRGEFIVFYLFTVIYFYLFKKKEFLKIFVSILLTVMVISPYLYRNYNHFNTFVLTKSFGYNLLKGNNPSKIVEGNAGFVEKEYDKKKLNIKTDSKYEIKLDDFYRDRAIEFIKNDPLVYLKFYFQKIFSLLFLDFNSSYPNYFNIFHILPKALISISSFIGGILVLKNRGIHQYLSLYYFLNILLFSLFFILPRYSLIFLPVQILLSMEFFKYLNRRLFN